jgi:hypothetical protein
MQFLQPLLLAGQQFHVPTAAAVGAAFATEPGIAEHS